MDQRREIESRWWENIKPWVYCAGHVCVPWVLGFIDIRVGAPLLTTGYTLARVFKSFIYGGGKGEVPIFFWNLFVTNSLVDFLKEIKAVKNSS